MTSDLMPQSPSTSSVERPARSAGSLLLPIAGGALVAGSLLYAAGLATSPPQASMAPADYIESLARDEGQTALSALLLHYGNLALGLGWLAAPALVRGRRGRIGTVVGALMAALGLVTVAGNVLFDFWTGAIGRELDAATALSLFESVSGSAGVAVVGTVTLLGLLGPLVALVGLARAGVTGWWLLAPAVAALALSMALTFSPLLYAGFALIGAVPAAVVGLRLIQRNHAEAAAA
ncbi:hypothetical protein E4P39_15215 [Blastococcus sp. CT_GayMR19]|uniref:hypothetical protein n=1 Tax=Blastococcus sp. CT_GayMR19 TaxID=2559608 RepID=UPI0010739EEC|nr:hypothetical protein [Blastococcus sp. CT_GayMR19]TFV73449.1 hypothetical protein E4P39_15215 [Blastococcus sp. CT_GayMR19]